jgi:hypothetical protein
MSGPRPLASLLATMLIGACTDPEPTRPHEITPEPAREAPPPEARSEPAREQEPQTQVSPPEQAPAPAPLPPPIPGRAHLFVLDDGEALRVDEARQLRVARLRRPRGRDGEDQYPEVHHPDERIRRLLNEKIVGFARADVRWDGELHVSPSVRDDADNVSCRARLATSRIVSVLCQTRWWGERGTDALQSSAVTFLIDDDGVHELEVSELFVPGTDITAAMAAAVERPDDDAAPIPADVVLAIGAEGFVIQPRHYLFEDEQGEAEYDAPFTALTDVLLATGPLAEALARPGLSTRTIDAPDPPREPAGASRWAVMPMAAFPDHAAAWLSLGPDHRVVLRRAGSHLVAPDEATARAVAGMLDTTASAVAAPAEDAAFVIVSTRHEVPLRSQPGSEDEVRLLERGTLLVTTEDPSGAAGERHLRVAAHTDLYGFVDRRQLELATCVPDLAPFLATLPEAARRSAALRTLRNSLSEGSWGRVTYVTEIDGQSHVELRRVEEGCTAGRAIAHFTRPGRVTSLATTRTAARGGDSLIVTVTSEPSVSIHTLGAAEPSWTHALSPGERVETSQREGDTWFPVVIVRPSGEPLRVSWGEGGPSIAEPVSP